MAVVARASTNTSTTETANTFFIVPLLIFPISSRYSRLQSGLNDLTLTTISQYHIFVNILQRFCIIF
jgi:hypothetical protein